MNALNIAQPDITLHLDMEGVIQQVSLSAPLAKEEETESWYGRPWSETVGDVGSDKVAQMLKDARETGVSAFRQVTQKFPSGNEIPMEYTAVRLGGKAGLVAVGKNLKAVAELQSRLIAAQQAMERDYWKLRETESRYRLLFDSSNEPVLLIRASNLHIMEANPAAIRALGMSPVGQELLAELAEDERDSFQSMLQSVRNQGKAPAMMIHLGQNQDAWLVRASLMSSDPGPVYLLQLSPVGAMPDTAMEGDDSSIDALVQRIPDAFVMLDRAGTVVRANQAFLDLVQIGTERSVVGERLGRWLWRPGADLTVLLANVRRHGVVRLFTTTIHGDLGLDTEVELSAAGDNDTEPRLIGVLLRDISRRLGPPENNSGLEGVLRSLEGQIGNSSLRQLVKDTVGLVERHYIESALDLTHGNRTAAAELLGLSRQSLYAKLNRYGMDGTPPQASDLAD